MGRSKSLRSSLRVLFWVQKMMGENQDMLKINMLKNVENLTGSERKSIFTSPLKHEETMVNMYMKLLQETCRPFFGR